MKRSLILLIIILLTMTAVNVQAGSFHFGITSAVKDKVKEVKEAQEERIRREDQADTDTTDNDPTISITSPADGSVATGAITVSADASDDKGVVKVEFYIDGTLKASDTTTPYNYSLDTALYSIGPHIIKATAYDIANQTASDQHTITFYTVTSGWQTETIESVSPDFFLDSSLALDSNNNPHIAYPQYDSDWAECELKYAKWTGTSWSITTVDSTGNAGPWASLALDSNDNPHIAYSDSTNSDLKYAHWTGTSWVITTVDSTGSVGSGTSLALDSNNNPCISYNDWGSSVRLKYAHWTGSSWDITIVDSTGDVGWCTSLALDSNNNPHIAYSDHTSYKAKYAKRTGSVWGIETVDPDAYVDGLISLVLDSNNNPHMSYNDLDNGFYSLKYASWTGSSWDISTVESQKDNCGWYNSLVLDSNNKPRLSYNYRGLSGGNNTWKYASWTGTSWELTTIDATANLNWGGSSLALDGNNNPRMTFTYVNNDWTTGILKYATWNP